MGSGVRQTYVPHPENATVVAEFSELVSQLREPAAVPCLIGADGVQHQIPAEAFDALVFVVKSLSEGKGVTVMPTDTQLTTQEAADYLGVSRPTLVKLLETGDIPFRKVGRHRRVALADLTDYAERSRILRREALDRLSRDAAAAGVLDSTAAVPPKMR